MSNILPSVFSALGKEALYQVSHKKPSIKEKTLGEEALYRVFYFGHFFAECYIFDTQQRALCRVSKI
jgi:hypothetical protein